MGTVRTVCHVHAPDSGAASEVQYLLGVLDGRKMQLVVEQDQEHVMGNVELVILDFVVWSPVLSLTELVVTAAIFVPMFPDSRWD